MDGDADTPDDAAAATTGSPRPWTPEAAMEPVPPLAPPPARPGAGTPVDTTRDTPPIDGAPTLLIVIALALAIVAVVVVAVVVIH